MKNSQFLYVFLLLSLSINNLGKTQTLPLTRSVDWNLAGLHNVSTNDFQLIDMQTFNVIGDGITSNDLILSSAIASVTGSGAILEFPIGNFVFNTTISIPSNIIIRGQGVENTTFTMDLGGNGQAISIQGTISNADSTNLVQEANKSNTSIYVSSAANFLIGDWIKIMQNDTSLITSSWAQNTVGQIIKIENIINNEIQLESPLRMDYILTNIPFIKKLSPVENVGIECLKILRIDDTTPQQTSTIYMKNAVNCWVAGVESENTTFSHILARSCSNIYISKSYFHHAFNYGVDGRAYGVTLDFTSNECLVENNIFEHLRHSMVVQAGANGNVFAYNYSFDPYWDSSPTNSAGDMVLHGNYPYCNLFEQNICENIVIDNSHGPNGPFNTFLRNRANTYGIFFSDTTSPSQNFLGNEITNLSLPYSVVNYYIQGDDHFIYGDNNKGTITPLGTDLFSDISYAYSLKPFFIPNNQWSAIGVPNNLNTSNIPAYDTYNSGDLFGNSCNIFLSDKTLLKPKNETISIYPNPASNHITINFTSLNTDIVEITIYNLLGEIIETISTNVVEGTNDKILDLTNYSNGKYLITILHSNKLLMTNFIKTN